MSCLFQKDTKKAIGLICKYVDRIFGHFHNEYYMIQQMNNQLVDAKRRLTRSNQQLEVALKENKEINEKLDAGMDAHIAKPVDFEKLKELLKNLYK